jgi:hypothetical protein
MSGFDAVLADLSRAEVGLRRSWPRSAEHLLLDVQDESTGERVAGQWFADLDTAERIGRATTGAQRRGRLVLHRRGADRKLRPLAGLLREPGSRLVAHRPERRAVVALDAGSRFAKVVRSSRGSRLRHSTGRAAGLPIRTPVLEPSASDAIVTTRALAGTPLSALLAGPRAGKALRAVGAAVARLHRCEPPGGTPVHGPADEVAVTTGWERAARAYGLPVPDAVEVLPPSPPALRLIHRDLHDGQLLLASDADGRFTAAGVGLLDFDLMAAGDPALDLANLIEHLVLRAHQGVIADEDSAVEALLQGYQPDEDTSSRVATYRALAARRLVAVYAFRTTNLVT